MKTLQCTVKYQMGSYQTNTVQGMRASCTHAEDAAAWNLGVKLLGEQLDSIKRIDMTKKDVAAGVSSRWLLISKEAEHASC